MQMRFITVRSTARQLVAAPIVTWLSRAVQPNISTAPVRNSFVAPTIFNSLLSTNLDRIGSKPLSRLTHRSTLALITLSSLLPGTTFHSDAGYARGRAYETDKWTQTHSRSSDPSVPREAN